MGCCRKNRVTHHPAPLATWTPTSLSITNAPYHQTQSSNNHHHPRLHQGGCHGGPLARWFRARQERKQAQRDHDQAMNPQATVSGQEQSTSPAPMYRSSSTLQGDEKRNINESRTELIDSEPRDTRAVDMEHDVGRHEFHSVSSGLPTYSMVERSEKRG
ncbi:uncharacterized protein BCR38DRAFT_163354 [Pseudomassariella vexata]|uniref:Uncharacterized protein n=1 Tax=Pseudomassariella vexata TaxID=1141098 RepID=A0A1Y2E830_9PEZI|nr:uncharacterized protein BCR38DRAFT_163354 [Pseudomassariella vexata]ORY67710.1 hypothetical protein BCR38DRAFT_163354 [Pseudomassariella vexata]